MVKILIIYYSRTGNTEKLAQAVAQGVKEAGGEAILKKVEGARVDDLLKADGIILGSPVYYGTMAAELKRFLDESVKFHGRLEGKIGGVFATSAQIGGGNETTILSLIEALLIHGLIIQGDPEGDHYGPVAIGRPNQRSLDEGQRLGKRVVELAKKLKGD